jgi:long-chain fatty acid transport protein
VALATLFATAHARADAGALFGDASRTAALAGAVTAQRAELSAIHFNPGGLADLDQPMLALGAHAGALTLAMTRSGEAENDMSRLVAGWSAAVGTPLPGPAWLSAFRFGLAAHLPAQHALRLVAPSRQDAPSFPLYADRAERTAVSAALAVRLFERLGLGAGIALSPRLDTPTVVTYDPARSDSPDENVVIDLERELELGASARVGAKAWPHERLSIGLAWRQEVSMAATGPNDTRAGTLLVDDLIDFYDFVEPDELALGIAVFPHDRWGLSADLVHALWSRYRTIHNEAPSPPFSDVWMLRLGVEHRPLPPLLLRGGYAFEPTPVPEQRATTNLLDADRHVLALGAGLDMRALGWAPLRIDAHARSHLLAEQRADKDRDALGDAQPDAPGRQIDNLGYPGFTAGGYYLEGGLTVAVFLGAAPARRPVAGSP